MTIFLNKSDTWLSSEASQLNVNSLLFLRVCLFNLFKELLSMSQRYTYAPRERQTLAVASPIPDAPAEIIIFFFL